MIEWKDTTLNTTDADRWVFDLDEVGFEGVGPTHKAKKAVADCINTPEYDDLTASLINPGRSTRTYVVVIER